jgi:hypothetical protein
VYYSIEIDVKEVNLKETSLFPKEQERLIYSGRTGKKRERQRKLPLSVGALPAIAVPTAATITTVAVATTTATAPTTASAAVATAAAIAIAIATACGAGRPLLLEAVATIHGAVFAWDKRNRRRVATVCANRFMLLAAWTLVGRSTSAITTYFAAFRAAAGSVRQAFRCKKFLLTGSKGKILATITAGKDTVLVSLVGSHG